MSDEREPIPPGRLKGYRVFFLTERLLAAVLFIIALTRTDQSTSGGIWWLLLIGAVGFAGLAAWSAYELVAKPGKV